MPKTTRRPAKPAAKPPATPPAKPAKRIAAAKPKSASAKPVARRGKAPRRWSAAEVHEAFSRFAKANPELLLGGVQAVQGARQQAQANKMQQQALD